MTNSRPICIIGTGYVGMACMIGLAELGWDVHGYDISALRIARLRSGIAPYRESGMDDKLQEHLKSGRLRFYDSLQKACDACDIAIVTVGTPSNADGSADLSALYLVAAQLSTCSANRDMTVIVRSTVPPGTSDKIASQLSRSANVLYAPEFLREGSAVDDFLHPDRIVVGSDSVEEALPYVRLFERLAKPVVFTSRRNAELIKCCSNAFLALKISFANEVANLCDALGAAADDVLRGVGYDRRIGADFLRPGIGFGGPCFEKDVKSIKHVAALAGVTSEIFSATLRVNEQQPMRIVSLLEEHVDLSIGPRIGVWGLAFKGGTDDVRDSLAMRIVEILAKRGAQIVAYDPAVKMLSQPPGCVLVATPEEATHADALLVLTDWPAFGAIDPKRYAANIRHRIIFDGRNVLDPVRVSAAGLRYYGIGRSPMWQSSAHVGLEAKEELSI